MRKIPTLFERDEKYRATSGAVTQGCEWVIAGEGVATRKLDGTACLVRAGRLYKRIEWDVQKGPAPASWLHHDFDQAQRSGHGWLPIGDGPEDWMHRLVQIPAEDGTYELVGPKVGKNPEGRTDYALIRHGDERLDAPRDIDGLRAWLTEHEVEGIVWHHPDGRMAKLKRRDFGIPWPMKR